MLCFSRDWHNPVQWSHYADKHRGICLGFDVPDSLLVPVQYTKEPPKLNWDAIELGGPAGEAEMLRWSTTKFEHWEYENEVRLFVARTGDQLQFEDFGADLRLREILIGPECTVTRQQVEDSLDGLPAVEQLPTRLAFGGYRIVIQRDSSRWI